ncbi:YhgE/Pip domain-containing protein [Mycolicibacterium flavescens]|uniref:YhgE/Pip domain-containing protein n=1 Tax=Mycolicibacterium flavescens TaxID=1776 RepID=UPI0021F34781|nr:YhgE/Pip domain-containing protein [Mycolicibacterium flavescens]MCV7278392.1 YhgE/Pip domain-containing protein [Mycolicibacterium flavescens]
MLAGLSLGTDIKRYARGTMPRIALVTIVALPLLYGAMYLWAFWNPFGEVNKVPVALVNEDTGTQLQGKQLRAGDEVARGLLDSGELDLTEVSADQAAAGLADGRFYFTITVPEDFSAAIASSGSDNPHKAQVRFAFNDANNYLGSIIGQNAAREVINEVNAKVSAQTVDTVLTGVAEAGAGLRQAADGAGQLAAGLDAADDGAGQLASGARLLADNLKVARDGAAQLAAGTGELSSSVRTATDPLLSTLDLVGDLQVDPQIVAEAAGHLSAAARSVTDRIAALNVDYAQAAAVVDSVVGGLRTNPDPAVRHLGETLARVHTVLVARGIDPATDEGLIRLRDGATRLENDLADPASQVRTVLTKVFDGGLKADLVRLRDGVSELDSGARQLSSGLGQLTDGGERLAAGADQLASGTTQLRGGAHELSTRLREGGEEVPSWTPAQRIKVATALSTPVALDEQTDNRAVTFGTGFAPFFLPLALFIGALIIWMLLTPLQARPVVYGLNALRVVLVSYWPAVLLALCQVLVMYTVVHFGVGLHPKYPIPTIAFLGLVAAAFLAMIQALNAVFGVAIGRVITLAFLMLQLVSAGGIYPVETTARPFQIIHPFDPMTYAVNGLRQLTVGGIDHRLWVAITVLSGILLVSLAASAWAARRNRQYTIERLHPPVEV